MAQREATHAQAMNCPQREVEAYFEILRWHLAQAITGQRTLQEGENQQGRLTIEEYNCARLWMTELLANGLGGARELIQAQELCKDALKDSPPLQYWAESMLERLNKECAQHQK